MSELKEATAAVPVGWYGPTRCGNASWAWNPSDRRWYAWQGGESWSVGSDWWQWNLGDPPHSWTPRAASPSDALASRINQQREHR